MFRSEFYDRSTPAFRLQYIDRPYLKQEPGTGNGGTSNREQGTGNRKQETGNRNWESLKVGIFKTGESLKVGVFKWVIFKTGITFKSRNLENGESLKAGIFKMGNLFFDITFERVNLQ